jgi:hypothetical protein
VEDTYIHIPEVLCMKWLYGILCDAKDAAGVGLARWRHIRWIRWSIDRAPAEIIDALFVELSRPLRKNRRRLH